MKRKRQYERFESPLFIEFRPVPGTATYSLGLTRNFSWEGFCFEFEGLSLEAGQNLEFKLRQPRTNFFVSFLGDVMWKEQNDFKCLAGIKFHDISGEVKGKILEMISGCSHIPVNSWQKKISEEPSLDDTFSENKVTHAPIIDDNSCVRGHDERDRSQNVFYRIALLIAAAFVLFLIPRMIDSDVDLTMSNVSDVITSFAFHESPADSGQPQLGTGDNTIVKEFIPYEALSTGDREEAITDSDEKTGSGQLQSNSTNTEQSDVRGYYVQVASFKDPEIGYEIFMKISNSYPDAYLFKQNNFYKIRIPNIYMHAEGVALIKEIEERFNIKSMLVQNTKG